MSDSQPEPEIYDVRSDNAGGMEYFDGQNWLPYRDPPSGPDLTSLGVIKGEQEADEEEPEAEEGESGGGA